MPADTRLDPGDAQGLIRAVTSAPEATWEGLLGMAAALGPAYFDAENCGAVLNRYSAGQMTDGVW